MIRVCLYYAGANLLYKGSRRARSTRADHLHVGAATASRHRRALRRGARGIRARPLAALATYRTLDDAGRLVLTQNRTFDEFEARLREVDLDKLVAADSTSRPGLAPGAEPGPARAPESRPCVPHPHARRRTSCGVDAELRPGSAGVDETRRLELVNLMLPNRLWVPSSAAGRVGA